MHLDISKGLSHNQINTQFKDSRGYMWFGTASGVSRYNGYSVRTYRNNVLDTTTISDNLVLRIAEDPHGRIWINESNVYSYELDRFSQNATRYLKEYGIEPGPIRSIIKDKQGRFWFLHATRGLYRYEKDKGPAVNFQSDPQDPQTIFTNRISALADAGKHLWVIHLNGVLEKVDGTSGKVLMRNTALRDRHKGDLRDYQFIIDDEDALWIFSANAANGLFYYQPRTNTFRFINETSSGLKLNNDIVRGIVQDNRGRIWIGTDHGGINVIDKEKQTVQYLLHRPEDDKGISQNSITSLYKDPEGIIWMGTFKKGVSYYHENIVRFPLYKHFSSDAGSLPFEDVNRFVEDDKGNLWIGTNGGGLIYFDRANGKFKQYKHHAADANSLSNDVIVSLYIDKNKQLWVGTYYGGLNRFDGKKFTRYKHNPLDPRTISDDNIWEIFEDSDGNIWIGTLYRGLDLYDPRTNSFKHFRNGDVNSVKSNYINAMMEDNKGNIWIGTDNGIDVLEKETGRFLHYGYDASNDRSLSNNHVLHILQDSFGKIWIGTREGFNLFDEGTKDFTVFREEHGLPHNSVLTVLEDDNTNLWLSTPNGLTNLLIDRKAQDGKLKFVFKTYDETDGLQGRQFNENAAYKTKKGELIFGGANGFNVFKPENLSFNKTIPRVILTDFQVFNKSVAVGEEISGRVVLPQAISETRELTLKHTDNVLSIEFAALNYFHPDKNSYRYKMEGFDEAWVNASGKSFRVTYTNLDPGTYTLRIKAANNDGVWNEEGASLKIHILPPFWGTPLAFILYALVFIGALLIARKILVERERMKFRLAQQRQEAKQMHELDLMKIKFFTNVSHEFRTPLTLILTPLEKMLKTTVDPDQHDQLNLIQRNARRLLNLVNKLLDFRKLEVDEVNFNPSEGDMVLFVKDTVYSFSDLSEKKDISLSFRSSLASLETIFDQDKLEKILFNLLSNAFKFTPQHGSVSVELKRFAKADDDKWIEISISDTGIGIAPENQEKIFERFFQEDLPKSMVNQGSGIGLAITKEFVKVHGGEISVVSEQGKGSTFRIQLPVNEVTLTSYTSTDDEDSIVRDEPQFPLLLLVEDNEDFRFYLKDNLKHSYRIAEAKDGAEGWSKAISLLPDLIVSDVMMPNMNGLELCQKIKSDSRTSHTAVILLTARSSEEHKLEGFEGGADDYITKPFSFELLQSRIKNLIHQREIFQKDFRRLMEVKASDLTITSLDETLIRKAIECVENNIAETDFSVEDLSHELGMSRVHLYKKLMALTGKSPLEFIRSIRLQQAAQLLEKSQLSVSEIAYKVGFNNPKYFARYFKDQYGVLPSAYQASKRG